VKQKWVRFNPSHYPRSVRDRVEIDYASKLSAEEKLWLARFNESEYGCNPEILELITGEEVSTDEKRRAWRENYSIRYDATQCFDHSDFQEYVDSIEIFSTSQSESVRASAENEFLERADYENTTERMIIERLKSDIKAKGWLRRRKTLPETQ